jgi:hypothetical protein
MMAHDTVTEPFLFFVPLLLRPSFDTPILPGHGGSLPPIFPLLFSVALWLTIDRAVTKRLPMAEDSSTASSSFFACYLLRSLNPRFRNSTYIG